VGVCAAAILLVHYVSERVMGSIRGSALSVAEVVAFVTFVWMMVQREKFVRKFDSEGVTLGCVLLTQTR
jgi:hypothetical protein